MQDTELLLAQLVEATEALCVAMRGHIEREEAELLPALRTWLGRSAKQQIVWGSLQTMPLRLLERVMPWLAQHVASPVRNAAVSISPKHRIGHPEN